MGSVQFQIAPHSSLHFSISIGPFRVVGVIYRDFNVSPVTSEEVPFVYLASVCRSLQCLISALTQMGGGGLLFRFDCSVVLWGGRGAADKCHWRVWGALTVFRPYWVCPRSQVGAFPYLHCSGSPAALYGAGPALHAVPVFGYSTKAGLSWACVLCLPWPEQLRQPGA